MRSDPHSARRPPTAIESKSYILLTGATGFVGQYLLRDLTLAGYRLAVVVRANKRLSARERIEASMQRWEVETGLQLPRPVLLEGDVRQSDFGLNPTEKQWVKEHVDTLVHSAAVLQFFGQPDAEPWQTNVGGTRHAIELAKDCRIDQFHYMSTAYTCGIRQGTVLEQDLDVGQEFRNDYERSKLQAEMLVHDSGLPSTTIYRPAVIVGDSRTGFTCSYHGLYVYLRLMALLIPQQQRDEQGVAITPIRLPMTGDEQRNLVPVDWVSGVVTSLIANPASHGRTYHLAPDQPVTARQIIDYCRDYFHSDGVEYLGPGVDVQVENQSEFAMNFLNNTGMYHAYECNDPKFDTRNLKQFAGDIPCPPLDAAMVHRFIEFGERDLWGKRRAERPNCDLWLSEQLPALQRGIERSILPINGKNRPGDKARRFGLSVRGPGGGDWTFYRQGDRLTVQPGWASDADARVELTSGELLNEYQHNGRSWENVARSWFESLPKPLNGKPLNGKPLSGTVNNGAPGIATSHSTD